MDYFVKSDSVGTISLFKRRKSIKLTHSGVLTDYQYYETFDYEPAMLNNFDDIRFVTQSGEHIPYWIETKTDGVSAKVWFMNDYVDGDTYIWMYYGNDALTSESSGSDTFIQWHGAATSAYHDSNIFLSNIIYESKLKRTAETHTILAGVGNGLVNPGDTIRFRTTSDTNLRYMQAKNDLVLSDLSETPAFPLNTYVALKFTFDGTTVYGYVDNNEISSGGISTNLPNENMGLWFNVNQGTAVQDWSFVRKYTAVEPTVTVGAEQHPKKGDMMIL